MAENEKLSEIRDILFGNNMSEYEKRFQNLEERVANESKRLQEETRKQISTLEKYTKDEIESLISQLKQEQNDRKSAIKKLDAEIEEFRVEFNNTREETNRALRETRAQLLDQSREFNEELQKQIADIRQLVNGHVEQLQNTKTDRSALAVLLNDMAMKLSGETESKEETPEQEG